MRHIHLLQARVQPGKMEAFIHGVQRWERMAFADDNAPESHSVYVNPDDPANIVAVTEFTDGTVAKAFLEAGMVEEFRNCVVACVEEAPAHRSLELFYGADASGQTTIFGEPTHQVG